MTSLPTRLSATTIKEWRRCPRRYFWARVEKLPVPTTPELELGTEVHAVLEAHVQGLDTSIFGQRPRTIAAPAIPWLDRITRTDYAVERRFAVPVEGATLSGIIDLAYVDEHEIAHGVDFKTTSDFKWMLSDEEAARDPQTVIYARVIRDVVFHRPIGSFRYLYLHKTKPSARELAADLSRLGEGWDRLVEDVATIVANQDRDPRAWRANTNACGDYGGCPFKSQCGKLGDGPMGFLQKLGAPAPSPSTPTAVQPPDESKTTEPARFNPMQPPAMTADAERARLINRLVAAGRDAADMERRNLVELAILAKQLDDPINPPDGTPREAAVSAPKKQVAQATALPTTGGPVDKAKLDELLAFFAERAGVDVKRVDGVRKGMSWAVNDLREDAAKLLNGGASTLLETVGSADDVPVKTQRKPKAEPVVEAVKAEPVVEAAPVTVSSLVEPTPDAKVLLEEFVRQDSATRRPFTIYVNCAPVRGGEIKTLDQVVTPIVRDVERAVGGDAFYGAIDYGKGPALVAAGLQRALEDGEIDLPDEISVDLRERYAPDCLSVLRRARPDSREIRGFV